MADALLDDTTMLARLIASWREVKRPLLLVDEVRFDVPGGQIVSFVILGTDTRKGYDLAEEASEIRSRMTATAREGLFKGSTLYGSRRRDSHGPFRDYVRRSLAGCAAALRVTTSSSVLERYRVLAPGGIHGIPAPGQLAPAIDFRGRELVPLLNMLKDTATRRGLGAVDVDVIVDRSKQMGLHPSEHGLSEDEWLMFHPGDLNVQADGSPASLICPSRFGIICPPKRSAVRDLLLLPDAAAYLMYANGMLADSAAAVTAGTDFFVEDVDLRDIASHA